MTLKDVEIQKTVDLLRSAPADRFVKAMMSLEQRSDAAEVVEIKKQLRDRIAVTRPPRQLNLTRIFCAPFEEMLRNRVPEGTSWIARNAIEPCWRIVEGDFDRQLLIELKRRLAANRIPERALLSEIGRSLWPAAGKALARVTAAAREGNEAALALFGGNAALLGQAEIIAAACQVSQAIEALKEIFPIRPFKTLEPTQKEELLTELRRLSIEGEHDLRCVIHIVAHWTRNPADIFDLCVDLDLGPATPIGRALTAKKEKVVIGLVGEQIETLQAGLSADDIDIADCAEMASMAVACLDSAIGLLNPGKDPDASGSAARMRQALGSMVKDRVVSVASQALSAVWDKGVQAGITAPGRDAVVAAEAAARAMRKCGKVASRLGVETAISREISSSLAAVRDGVDEKIASLTQGADAGRVTTAKATVANATRILEILEGPERAYEFYREKRHALSACA